MPSTAAATPAAAESATREPADIVVEFLDLCAADEIDRALELLDPDVLYTNVGLPTVRGKARVRALAERFDSPASGFEVYYRAVAQNGDTVLTDRVDALTYGPFRSQFWVYGRFEVRDGLITVWRDSFDWFAITRASLRGIAGILLPALRAKPPAF
ncbi:MAG: nuclear transport factor 2 family protein [Solirubrobacteraceae bacterium]|nr:nuclear transport factor 2 family protein [Solirubrobacteraceae bacterium]